MVIVRQKNKPIMFSRTSVNWSHYEFYVDRRQTVIGQLTQLFNIQKVWARDLWHLTNRISRKLLSHSMAVLLNRFLERNNLQFDGLIK